MRRFVGTLLLVFALGLGAFAIAQDAQRPAQPPSRGEDEASTSVTTEVEPGPSQVRLDFKELCKTEEGRRLYLSRQDELTERDHRRQWEGLKMNGLPTEATYEEFALASIAQSCNEGLFLPAVVLSDLKPLGTCDAVRFGPPTYDLARTVQMVEEIVQYYRAADNRFAGATPAEREANIKRRVGIVLDGTEAGLRMAYLDTGCKVGNTGRCAASTGQERICEKVYISAPPYQELIPESLKGLSHVKVGPILESPTVAWFKVGRTGSGENFGTATARSRFSNEGAKTKAKMDVDAIRRELVRRNLPVDRAPAELERPRPPPPVNRTPPPPAAARITVQKRVRPGNPHFYEVLITNTGGSPATVSFRIWNWDRFYQSLPAQWRSKEDVSVVIQPGSTYAQTFSDLSTESESDWWFERL